MMWLYLAALTLIGLIVVILVGAWNGAQPPQDETPGSPDDVDELLARRAEEGAGITAEDLDAVQLQSGVRGYRMDQVDRLLDALKDQLRASERP